MNSILVYVEDYDDAVILFEASRIGILNLVKERLSFTEKLEIKAGSVFIYNETETGIKRWTDSMSWTSGRLNDGFFNYVRISSISDKFDEKENKQIDINDDIMTLRKKSISLINPKGDVIHLVNYYNLYSIQKQYLKRPVDLNIIDVNELKRVKLLYKLKFNSRNSSYSSKNDNIDGIKQNKQLTPLPQLKLSETDSKNLNNKLYDEDRRQKDLLKPYISL